ncbi:AMP-binding protein [Celerinatantimonas sp. YJH-8]|uniref:AMP-binding protein n=1 Tax=Celerinatantimonas sp. YJH-8 TaxID=3228714 RepID=UPI0038C31E27
MKTTRLSHSQGETIPALIHSTIGERFDHTVNRFPNHEALVSRHQCIDGHPIRLSYRQLQEQVNLYARALLALGVQKGDRFGIWSPNCVQWCIAQLATAKIGAILIGINPAFRSHELQYILEQSQCNWLLTADSYLTNHYTQMLNELIPELHNPLSHPFQSKKFPALKAIITLSSTPIPGMIPWDNLPEWAETLPVSALAQHQSQLTPEDPINIQYTSGTTGFAKGATLSHFNILNNSFFITHNMGFTEKDRLVIPVPLYHCFGIVLSTLGCINHGSTMIYSGDLFSPLAVLRAVAEEKATALYGVPSMFIAQLNHPRFQEFDLTSLRTGIIGGAPCSPALIEALIDNMHIPQIQIAYGMTETSPISVQTSADDPLDKRVNSVGKTQPHQENKIIDRHGNVVPRGQMGEICTRGYSVMLGYWNNPKATTENIDIEGWFHSGDLAIMDEQGYISIVGRCKDMIIRGGENIHPREIEDFLYTHPAIDQVQITGVESERFGEEIKAWIRIKPGYTLTETEVKAFCKDQIADYKIPRYVAFVEHFPMTTTGKVQKFKLPRQHLDTDSESTS